MENAWNGWTGLGLMNQAELWPREKMEIPIELQDRNDVGQMQTDKEFMVQSY